MNDDDVFVALLREEARDAVPASSLDPRTVLAASRRKRRVIRVAGAAAALVVAGVAVVGGVNLAGGWDRPVPPVDDAPAPTGPEPTEDGIVVGIAEGVWAVNRPVEMTLADGAAVLDVGMGDLWSPLVDRLALTTGPAEGTNPAVDVDPVFDAALPGAEVRLWLASIEGLRTRILTLVWLPEDRSQDYPDGVYPAPTKFVESESGQTLLIGAVPSWITDPTVTLHLGSEVRLADGTTGRSMEVPTFAAPTQDGRLLYLIAFDPTAGVSDGEGYAVTIADGAGETITAGCADGDLQACIAAAANPDNFDTRPQMCAEFPIGAFPGGTPAYEGWWNVTPATEGGDGVRTDPADWPPIMREHPQSAQVDTRTGKVIETYDRYACGPVAGYVIPDGLELPPDAVVILDAVTGEILETFSPPYFEPQW